MGWLEESKAIGYPLIEKGNLAISESNTHQNFKSRIPYGFTFVVLLLGFFNLGSAAYQYYSFNLFSFLEITQGMVGILMIIVSIFLMIKLKVKTSI